MSGWPFVVFTDLKYVPYTDYRFAIKKSDCLFGNHSVLSDLWNIRWYGLNMTYYGRNMTV